MYSVFDGRKLNERMFRHSMYMSTLITTLVQALFRAQTLTLTICCSLCSVTEDKLYVVMELIEGAPLGEHFNSLKEKGTRFSEERIWHIFIQVC